MYVAIYILPHLNVWKVVRSHVSEVKWRFSGEVCLSQKSSFPSYPSRYSTRRVGLIAPSCSSKLVPVVFLFLLVYYLRKQLSFSKSEWFWAVSNIFRLQWEFQWENDQNGQNGCFCLFWGYRKWHFGCPTQNSKTTFQYKYPPKTPI